MNFYEQLDEIFPYLVSIRKLENYISVDVEIPTEWKLPKKYVDEKKVMEQDSNTPNHRFFSFVSEILEEDIERTSQNIQNIIKYNLEREEKEKLFEEKVNELKIIFEKQTLKSLKNLKFEIKLNKIELEDGEESITTTDLVEP